MERSFVILVFHFMGNTPFCKEIFREFVFYYYSIIIFSFSLSVKKRQRRKEIFCGEVMIAKYSRCGIFAQIFETA